MFDEEQRGEFDEWEREVAGLKQEMEALREENRKLKEDVETYGTCNEEFADQLTAVTEERDEFHARWTQAQIELDTARALLDKVREDRDKLLIDLNTTEATLEQISEAATCCEMLCEWLDVDEGRQIILVNANMDIVGANHTMYYSTDWGQTNEQVFGSTRAECLEKIEEKMK